MNTSKLFLLFEQLNKLGKVRFINRRLIREFSKDDILEAKLWQHVKKCGKLKRLENIELSKAQTLSHVFDNDSKALNRTASRLFKRIKSILVSDFVQKRILVEDWLFRETLKGEPNRISQLLSDNFITNKYEAETSFEKDLNTYARFHITYEKYLEDNLKNAVDISLFVKARQLLDDYYVKYHSILEIERLSRSRIVENENIKTLKTPVINNNQSLLESELLLQKINALDKNPHHFDFCFNWFVHVVEENLISMEMQKVIFPILYNFSVRNSAENGNPSKQVNIDKIIYLALDKKILYAEGRLSAFIYVNFLSAVSVEPKKSKDYINKYLKEVDSKEYAKAAYISKLYLAFYSNNFEEVLIIINRNEDDVSLGFDPSLKSKIKFFLIRSYFELRDKENFMKQYLSSKRYYKSLNLSQRKEDELINALEFLKDLYFIKDTKQLLRLEQKLNRQKVAIKSWLIAKIKKSPFYPKGELLK